MAFNGKYVSIRQIIEKAFRDSGIDNIDYEAAIEWAAELMGLIGVPYFYVDKSTNGIDIPPLVVSDFRTTLPIGLTSIQSVRKIVLDVNGNVIHDYPMIEVDNVANASLLSGLSTGPVVNYVDLNLEDDELVFEDVELTNNNPIIENLSFYYKVQNNYIYTNFEDGFINLSYRSYPIDEDGLLLIPDDDKYKKALEYYIIYRIDWKRWRANPASPGLKAVVNDSESQYMFYVSSARNKAHIPSVDKMEGIKNSWIRLIPKYYNHNNNFSTSTIPEMRRNRNSR
jgi:hypothetical protein